MFYCILQIFQKELRIGGKIDSKSYYRGCSPTCELGNLREREKGPDGNNHGMFRKRWADHNYHEEGGESIAMVQKRNIEALNEILSDNTDKDIVIGTHGTALSTILNFYDSNFGCEDFLRIIDWMPYIIELDFESSCNELESECPIYSFKLIAKQEHCYIEKEFKGKQHTDKK